VYSLVVCVEVIEITEDIVTPSGENVFVPDVEFVVPKIVTERLEPLLTKGPPKVPGLVITLSSLT
jgi:hypothetical protein